LIHFFGDYQIDNEEDEIEVRNSSPKDYRKDEVTYNVIMEFADMDLDELLNSSNGPWIHENFIEFWSKFFELAKALKDLDRMPDEGRTEYTTLHGDLKLANIVSVNGQFKLIDFANSGGMNSSIGVDKLPSHSGKTRTFGMYLYAKIPSLHWYFR
jgi:serine/threonine protein kinase